MDEAPDITATLRKHREDLAETGRQHLDTIEVASASGDMKTVRDQIDSLHALIDLLAAAPIVTDAPGMDEIMARLDVHAIDLAENDDYEGARTVIETAEAFGRRKAQIDDQARTSATHWNPYTLESLQLARAEIYSDPEASVYDRARADRQLGNAMKSVQR